MASHKRARKVEATPVAVADSSSSEQSWWEQLAQPRVIFGGLALAVLLFYYQPLFSSAASIQWDAADVQYSPQKYLSEMLHTGKAPFWTPHVFSGAPFLADPQVGAWNPLNWPFFLLGITPRAIEWQLALHALLAAVGGYLLARDLLRSRAGAVFTGVFFAFSGLFAETSSHVGPFQATAWLPALLWAGRRAARDTRWLPVLALCSGCLVLTGHFQTALYSFFALAVFLAADFAIARGSWIRSVAALVCAAAAAATLPAVMVLPGLELTAESVRAGADFSSVAGAALVPGALVTLVSPNYYNALGPNPYTGPQDITQFYLYMGLLLLPLAAAGLAAAKERWYGLALVIPGAWYAFGPPGGLYSVIAMLPGFRSVRAPIQMWFVAALGLALLAGAGVGWLRARFRSPWIPLILIALVGFDLYYWNMRNNPLAYARTSFQDLYGANQDRFQSVVAPLTRDPMHRIHMGFASPGFGPLNGTLDSRIEVTYGYNPLELWRYQKYIEAAGANAKLLNGLAVTAIIDPAKGNVQPNADRLPRIFAPDRVSAVRTKEEALARIAALDPAHEAVVEGAGAIPQNGGASVQITAYEGDLYRARYQAAHPTLLRIAAPYFPGWQAEVDGRALPVAPVDLALMGVVAPEGSHELVVRYRPTRFATGAAISAVAWLAVLVWLWWGFRKPVAAARRSE
jgi:Bacterial membrane protein YfhO